MKSIALTIEKGIPKPVVKRHRNSLTQQLRDMSIDDSFVIESGAVANIRNLAVRAEIKVSAAQIGDGKSRVWRTA